MGMLLWIDDQKTRAETAKQIGVYLDLELKFVHVTYDMDVDDILGDIYEADSPDLVFIDHYLAAGDLVGSSLVAFVVAQWPSVAIIGITGATKRESISLSKERYYTYLVEQTVGSGLRYQRPKIKSILDGFSAIRISGFSASNYGDLFICPELDQDLLIQLIPEYLLPLEESGVHMLFHWMQDSFLNRPGILYDSSWAAASMGLTDVGFSIVAPLFEAASYQGVFSCKTEPRWWKSQLWSIGFKLVSDEVASPSRIGEGLDGIESKHLVKCACCKEHYTEVLAYSDRTKSDSKAVHRRCCHELPTHREFFSEPDYVVVGA